MEKQVGEEGWLSQRLNESRRNYVGCDVEIKVNEDEDTIVAHKLVLSLASPFFHNLFLKSSASTQAYFVINDDDMDRDILDFLIKFIYTCKIGPINEDNVFKILKGAKVLELDLVVDACDVFLGTMVSKFESCLQILLTPPSLLQLSSNDLIEPAIDTVLNNLDKLMNVQEFCVFSYNVIERTVNRMSYKLTSSSVHDTLLLVFRWVKHDVDRRICVADLLSKIPRLREANLYYLIKLLYSDINLENNNPSFGDCVWDSYMKSLLCTDLPEEQRKNNNDILELRIKNFSDTLDIPGFLQISPHELESALIVRSTLESKSRLVSEMDVLLCLLKWIRVQGDIGVDSFIKLIHHLDPTYVGALTVKEIISNYPELFQHEIIMKYFCEYFDNYGRSLFSVQKGFARPDSSSDCLGKRMKFE